MLLFYYCFTAMTLGHKTLYIGLSQLLEPNNVYDILHNNK